MGISGVHRLIQIKSCFQMYVILQIGLWFKFGVRGQALASICEQECIAALNYVRHLVDPWDCCVSPHRIVQILRGSSLKHLYWPSKKQATM